MPNQNLASESVWLDKPLFDDAESNYYTKLAGNATDSGINEVVNKINSLELENTDLRSTVNELVARISKLETRVTSLESPSAKPAAKAPAPKAAAKPADDDDDDVDLFGSESSDEESKAVREKRLKEYGEKKLKKPGPIAKSSVILDVKPWDDETDMKELEKCVRSIQKDGLIWGVSKFMPVAYNVKKLQIVVVVEDDKVSIEELTEQIEQFEDYVQSVDIAAFNKI